MQGKRRIREHQLLMQFDHRSKDIGWRLTPSGDAGARAPRLSVPAQVSRSRVGEYCAHFVKFIAREARCADHGWVGGLAIAAQRIPHGAGPAA